MTSVGRAVVQSIALLGLACSAPSDEELATPATPATESRPQRLSSLRGFNVILVVIDTLRADHLGFHGYSRATSPQIDRLAAEGVAFLEARSPSSFTRESVAALLTGEHSSCSGAAGWSARPPSSVTTLAEHLREAGYVTGFLSNSPVVGLPGFTQGFDEIEQLGEEWNASGRAAQLTDRAGLFLERNREERFFLYLHYLDPHGPYEPPPRLRRRVDVRERDRPLKLYGRIRPRVGQLVEEGFGPGEARFEDLVARYDAEIMLVDESVGELRGQLEQLDLSANSIVVLTSDHGEEFLEHGYVEHAWTLYRESLHVPLFFWAPKALAPSRISTAIALIDVLPSLLDLLEVPTARGLPGRSLFHSDRDGAAETVATLVERPVFGELLIGWRNQLRSVEHEGWKYVAVQRWLELSERREALKRGPVPDGAREGVWGPTIREELYDLEQDPEELRSRAATEPERLRRMRALLEELRVRCSAPRDPVPAEVPLDSTARERLRALGYVD